MAFAETACIRIERDTHAVIGIAYLAATDDPAPFAIFLHGIPGSEKNHDLAYEMRRQGWHVLVLHFSGAWGSGGAYNPIDHPHDVRAALDYFLSGQAPRPVDPERVVLVGYSLGTRSALLITAEDQRVSAVVTMGAICDYSELLLADEFFAEAALFLATNAADLKQNWIKLGSGIQPVDAIAHLAPRPVLVMHGTDDQIVPYYHADALAAAGEHVKVLKMEGAGHGFDSHRPEVIATVVDFLEQHH